MAGTQVDGNELDRWLFNPKSIAVVGASARPGKVGNVVLNNILESGYPGKVYPVNDHAAEINGMKCHPNVNNIPGPVDLAVVIVPARFVPGVVSDCAAKGVSGCIVISAGFREVGVEGRRLERDMVSIAHKGGMRIFGPNCLGMMNTLLPLNATFARLEAPGGSIGLISQSGAVCTSLLDLAGAKSIGYSKIISMGNSSDLTESDFLRALADDEATKVISIYLEGVSSGKRFYEELQRATGKKPVVIFKSGTTRAGARAASSHTGALAGSEKAYSAVCKQAQALRAGTMDEFIELSCALSVQELPKGPRLAIVTNAGGPGIIAADACEREGLMLSSFEPKTTAMLRDLLPEESNIFNPVDVLGDADATRYSDAIETVLKDPNVDSLLVILTPQAMTEIDLTADRIVNIAKKTRKSVFSSFIGSISTREAASRINRGGVPDVTFPDKAIHIMADVYDLGLRKRKPRGKYVEFESDRETIAALFETYQEKSEIQLGPEDCRTVLTAYGINCVPFRIAHDTAEGLEIAREMEYPVAMKIVSPQILHKTELGGVKLGINNRDELENAYQEITMNARRLMPGAQIEGVGIQKMAPLGKELIVGVVKDPQFGPMVMVGLGGIYVETFGDVSFRIAPFTDLDADDMIHELEAFRLLAGVRGEAPSDIGSVKEVLLRISQLSKDNPEINEMDINPLVVYNAGGGCTCLDVRITIGGAD